MTLSPPDKKKGLPSGGPFFLSGEQHGGQEPQWVRPPAQPVGRCSRLKGEGAKHRPSLRQIRPHSNWRGRSTLAFQDSALNDCPAYQRHPWFCPPMALIPRDPHQLSRTPIRIASFSLPLSSSHISIDRRNPIPASTLPLSSNGQAHAHNLSQDQRS